MITTHDYIDLGIKGLSALTLIAGGGWAIYKYFIFTESFPKIIFTVDLIPKFIHKDSFVCEVIAEIENTGNVRVEITEMSFSIHALEQSDSIDESDEDINFQMMFPHPVKTGTWFPKSWEETFIETKTKQVYRFICSIGTQYEAVVVHGKSKYSNTFHTANRLISLAGQKRSLSKGD